MNTINCYISTMGILLSPFFAYLGCGACMYKEGCYTYMMHMCSLYGHDTHGHLIPTTSSVRLWVWAWGSHICQRLRTLLHSPSLPPVLSLAESVIADVVRVCEVAKTLNLAFEIVVPVTSNSRFRKTIHSSMKDQVLKEGGGGGGIICIGQT